MSRLLRRSGAASQYNSVSCQAIYFAELMSTALAHSARHGSCTLECLDHRRAFTNTGSQPLNKYSSKVIRTAISADGDATYLLHTSTVRTKIEANF